MTGKCVFAGIVACLVLACSPQDAPSETAAPDCDQACLTDLVARYLDALVAFDGMAIPGRPVPLPWSDRVRFTENDVGLQIGDGLWGTATAINEGYVLADPETANALWFGIVEEHGQAAYLALRLGAQGQGIAEIETVVGREGTPAPFASTAGYALDPVFSATVPAADRLTRADLVALVDGYYQSLPHNDGTVHTEIADDCERLTNGFSTTHGPDVVIRGCREQLELGLYQYVERVRAVRFPIVDTTRGVVVALALVDHAAHFVDYQTLDGIDRKVPIEYPNTHSVLEVFKIEDGKVSRIEGVTAFQPYLMPSKWMP